MLDIFHKLPPQAKKFLETQGEGAPSCLLTVPGLACTAATTSFVTAPVARVCRGAAGHCGAHDWPRRVAAQAAWGGGALQVMVTVSATPDPLLKSVSHREVSKAGQEGPGVLRRSGTHGCR